MAIAKMKIGGKWVNLYADEINSRLKISENLADVADKAIARENLELIGDVTTHNHDSTYLPLIQQMTGSNVEISGSLVQEKQERIAEDAKIHAEIDSLENNISTLQQEIDIDFATLETKMQTVKSEIESIKVTASNAATDSFVSSTTKTSSGSGNSVQTTTTKNSYNTKNGIPAGTYDLEDIIQKLVTLAHKHDISSKSTTWECDCSDSCVTNNDCH